MWIARGKRRLRTEQVCLYDLPPPVRVHLMFHHRVMASATPVHTVGWHGAPTPLRS
jgi:hypothetical protein